MGDEINLDMEHRDVNQLNNHISVSFEDTFGEPDVIHSIDCVWRNSYKCYNCTLSCCYKFLTILCAIPLAFCWGFEFACAACCHVWWITPSLKMCSIDFEAIRKFYLLCLNACMGPCCETCGLLFAKIGKN